jgi:hypothetical protein
MKRTIFAFLVMGLATGLAGCVWPQGRGCSGLFNGSCQNAPENCAACGDPSAASDWDDWGDGEGQNSRASRDRGARMAAEAGPATGAITYPYYTLHGPRDYLARNPQRLGP